jgi:hypothetical protein
VRPRRLAVTDTEAMLELEVVITNVSGALASGVRMGLAMASANPQQDVMCAGFHLGPAGEPAAPPFELAREQGRGIAGVLHLPLENLHVVRVGGRPMFVPMVMVDLTWMGGLSIRRHGADFMIGTAGQGEKLGPIWLDRRQHAGLAASRYFPRPVADLAPVRQPA